MYRSYGGFESHVAVSFFLHFVERDDQAAVENEINARSPLDKVEDTDHEKHDELETVLVEARAESQKLLSDTDASNRALVTAGLALSMSAEDVERAIDKARQGAIAVGDDATSNDSCIEDLILCEERLKVEPATHIFY